MLDRSTFRNKPRERPWYKPALELLNNKPKTHILDLGCGLCEFSIKLKASGFKVTCADGSLNYVKRAKKLGFPAYCVDFNEKLHFKNNSFDGIVLLEVIEHIEKAEQLLSEIHRILKLDGWFLLSTTNVAYFGLRLFSVLGYPPPDEGYHFRFFTYNSLKKKLQIAGFKITKQNSITFLPIKDKKIIKKYVKLNFWSNLLSHKLILLCEKTNT